MILRVFEQIFKIQPTAQCIIYCWSFGHFTCYEMSMSRSTYIMIIKLFVCECTKDDDREVAALIMSTRLWNCKAFIIDTVLHLKGNYFAIKKKVVYGMDLCRKNLKNLIKILVGPFKMKFNCDSWRIPYELRCYLLSVEEFLWLRSCLLKTM